MNASLGMDDDEYLIRQVEAVEASFGLNSQTAERVQGSKDKDSGAAVDAVCGVNPASSNILQQNSTQQEKQKICALGTIMENESKKRAHVETAEDAVCGVNPDNMHQQNCMLQEKEKSCGEGTVVEYGNEDEDEDDEDYDYNEEEYEDEDDDEDEDDGENEYKDDVGNEDTNEDDKDYDYNGWHEFVGNDCERDEDDDFVDVHQKEGVVDGLVVTVMSVLGSPKLEVKGLEEANGQGLQVDLRQANSVAI
ncbi:glutamic acid-rich protein-like [Brassica napus]|uniref:glutamic acid-rich protein-like n=1 Tax=Brassica napus TaxID=3708 RepID=UPI00207A98BC|nr:glutamic acid-rich protein-like [Brassica napus]